MGEQLRPSKGAKTATSATGDTHGRSKRALTEAEKWFRDFNSAYRVRVDDHYETAVERRLPFTGG
jgi:hypothetical protein